MSSASELFPLPAGASVARRPVHPYHVAGAFALAFLTTLCLVGAAVLAWDASHDGRVLPGVRVGSVDLSGLDRQAATAALAAGYSSYGNGRLTIRTDTGDVSITFAEFSRRPDVEAMVDDAMRAGRTGSPLDRAFAEPRLALQGLDVEPRVALDESSLAAGIARALTALEREPLDATISMNGDRIAITEARPGRRFGVSTAVAAALDALRRSDAPSEVMVRAPSIALRPAHGDAAVLAAKAAAERIMVDVTVTHGSRTWTIPASTVRGWVGFEYLTDGSVGTRIDEAAIPAALGAIAKAVLREPVSARLLTGKGGTTVGVTASKDGLRLDAEATAATIAAALGERAQGEVPTPVPAAVVAVAPKLTTAEAEKIAPLMTRLSSWKTRFPISERNFWGANIWLPAKYINGTVLEPGERFEWFSAVGPITRARGFGPGGVIDGDHTDPTGAIGGGMCSSSTTLFNAALRAGLHIGARTNHSYYINRYPLGLDATITIKGGSTTTMAFTNDMDHPILIRGFKVVGSDGLGWVRYEIWGVPDGRTVSLGKPVVTNVQRASTNTFDVTWLPTGVRRQTEYPSNGMDVSVSRIVRDRDGNVIHRNTYRSHYLKWDGRIEVGI